MSGDGGRNSTTGGGGRNPATGGGGGQLRGDGGGDPSAPDLGAGAARPAGTLDPADAAITVAFVCVQNAGRSQMATAFAERERAARDLEDDVAIVTGGTRPADRVHDGVVDAMAEIGIDLADREPREVPAEELRAADYVLTMGCDAAEVCPAGWGGASRDWDLDDPDGAEPAGIRDVRDEVEGRVRRLFDEVAARIDPGDRRAEEV